MKSNHITDHITDYLDGTLPTEQHNEVALHLAQCERCTSELEEVKALLAAFKKEVTEIPSPGLKSKFYAFLEEEKQDSSKVVRLNSDKKWLPTLLKIAAGIALLFGAFSLGKFQQQQQTNEVIVGLENKSSSIKETAMLSLIENQSASKRIQGVNLIEEIAQPDATIINALADRMLHDQNTNVRLTAAEALGKFSNSQTVIDAFISALGTEKDPSIQIMIIHTLSAIQEKKAIAPMKKLLEQQETQPFVKKEIKALLPTII